MGIIDLIVKQTESWMKQFGTAPEKIILPWDLYRHFRTEVLASKVPSDPDLDDETQIKMLMFGHETIIERGF